jgi:uncharacterized heparinase superfamily protein
MTNLKIIRKISLYFHTIRYLKFRQIYFRLFYFIYRPLKPKVVQVHFELPKALCGFIKSPQIWVSNNAFCFLNQKRELTFPDGWKNQVSKLWLYNLHYFEFILNTSQTQDRQLEIIERWISDNPYGQGIGWDSYPTSLRIINWVKWNLEHKKFIKKHLDSLFEQGHHLQRKLEYHLGGNHLFVNGIALLILGIAVGKKKWELQGVQIVKTEVAEQILDDGGHFELSPMYHGLVLRDLLDLLNILIGYGRESLVDDLKLGHRICRMLTYYENLSHPDGEVAFFNDSVSGIAPSFFQLKDYARVLGISPLHIDTAGKLFKESGYFVYRNSKINLIVDAGNIGPDYIPGHAHADTLSFELSLYGKRLFVNRGISTYEVNTTREDERSTASHNTCEIDGVSSSEVWSSFRVARRARSESTWLESDSGGRLACSHNGYIRLEYPVEHQREFIISGDDISILDTFCGQGSHHFAIRFFLHPEVSIVEGARGFKLLSDNRSAEIFFKRRGIGKLNSQIIPSTFNYQFGHSIVNKGIIVTVSDRVPLTIETNIQFKG